LVIILKQVNNDVKGILFLSLISINMYRAVIGKHGNIVVETLCYKLKGSEFET
jgi:hypothetical protein